MTLTCNNHSLICKASPNLPFCLSSILCKFHYFSELSLGNYNLTIFFSSLATNVDQNTPSTPPQALQLDQKDRRDVVRRSGGPTAALPQSGKAGPAFKLCRYCKRLIARNAVMCKWCFKQASAKPGSHH